MVVISICVVVILYLFYVILDIVSIVPRVSGSIVNIHGIAYSFEVMVNTVKRVFIVSYPPFLGYIITYGNVDQLFYSIFISYFVSSAFCILVLIFRGNFVTFFCAYLDLYSTTGRLFYSFFHAKGKIKDWKIKSSAIIGGGNGFLFWKKNIDFKIFILALWIIFFYSSSIFLINIIGFFLSEYSGIILQMTGFFNAFGTMALAFFLDPKLSRIYEQGEAVTNAFNSLLISRFFNLAIVSPVFFYIVFLISR